MRKLKVSDQEEELLNLKAERQWVIPHIFTTDFQSCLQGGPKRNLNLNSQKVLKIINIQKKVLILKPHATVNLEVSFYTHRYLTPKEIQFK